MTSSVSTEATDLGFFLSRPYKWVISLGTGLFFYIFLIVFLPFGVDNYNPDHEYSGAFLLEISHFMTTTASIMLANEFLLKSILIRKVNMRAVLGWSAWLLVILGLGNYLLYNWLGNWHDLSVNSGMMFILNCSSVFIFPIAGIFFFFRYQNLSSRLQEIRMQPPEAGNLPELIEFRGEGRADQFSIAADSFRYAQAQDNYVALFYLKNGDVRKELIRSSLSELLERTACDDLVRCHRSYAVNLRRLHSVRKGNPMLLYLKDLDKPIRVSRSYREAVLSRLPGPPENP